MNFSVWVLICFSLGFYDVDRISLGWILPLWLTWVSSVGGLSIVGCILLFIFVFFCIWWTWWTESLSIWMINITGLVQVLGAYHINERHLCLFLHLYMFLITIRLCIINSYGFVVDLLWFDNYLVNSVNISINCFLYVVINLRYLFLLLFWSQLTWVHFIYINACIGQPISMLCRCLIFYHGV